MSKLVFISGGGERVDGICDEILQRKIMHIRQWTITHQTQTLVQSNL